MKRLSTFLMALLLTWIGANAQTITSGGTYMLQNVETGYFLGGGGTWGTQAVTLARPQQFTITSSNGGYTLHSYQGRAAGGYLTQNLYVDTDASDVDWIITEGEGDNADTYTISCSSGYLSAAGAEAEDVAIEFSQSAEYWRIISPDDIKKEMETASVDNPVDVTGLIMNPTLNAKSNGVQTDGVGDLWGYWTVTGYNTDDVPSNFTFAQHDANPCARVVETWHSDDGFDIRQTISDLPAGLYKFSAQGFYRSDGAVTTYPVIYAEPEENTYEVTLKSLSSSDAGSSIVGSGTMTTAYNAFLAEYYPNEIEFIMREEGDATIGFRSDLATDDAMWTVFGEINLTYYGVVEDDCDYEKGAEIEMNNFSGTVASGNLFKNGGFNNGVVGWNAGSGYTKALSESNVTLSSTGGYNGGQYVTITATGATDEKTPTQAIAVTPGKSYLLVGYTKYNGDDENLPNSRYSALFAMSSATHEASHYENGTSYSNDLVELEIVKGDTWVQTEGIFTVPAEEADSTFSYVGMRMNWSTASYDGLQLYELDGEFTFPEDADYVKGDEVTDGGTTYVVKTGENLFTNGSFNERTTGWTYGNAYTNPLGASQVTYSTDGGYNDGPFITSKGGSSSADTTPSQAVAVTSGKTYLFVGYTKGTAPENNNEKYNGLMQMTDATTEASSGNDPIEYVAMKWGDPSDALNGWTKTEAVFTATTSYAGVRFAWCPDASFDGFQLYEVEEVASEVEWTMTEAGWGTLILPFASTLDSGLTAYSTGTVTAGDNDDDATLSLSPVEGDLAANTPYIIGGTAGTYTFTGTPVEATTGLTSGLLTGTFVDMTYDNFSHDGTQYLLQNHGDDGGVAFYPVVETYSKDATLTPYHCYLTYSGASPVRGFISFPDSDGEATAIVAVEGAEEIANGAIYDLSGRRVAKAVKGVYIQNGKKVLVK